MEIHGERFCALTCKYLEGTTRKRKHDPYIVGEAQWVKIRSTAYSQWVGWEKLVEHKREAISISTSVMRGSARHLEFSVRRGTHPLSRRPD